MTVPVTRQPNIEPGLSDQTSIVLNLFNTILQTTNTWVELERSWAVIERDISIQEQWEARQRQLRNQL
jgi:peroxiredoxin